MELRLADVVPYDDYESAAVAFGRPPEELDPERLVRTLIYGHDDWLRAASGVADIREAGFTANAVGDVAAGGALGAAAVAGWVPAAGWKALAGALGAAGLAVGARRAAGVADVGRFTAKGRAAAFAERARELEKLNPLLADEIAEYGAREARSLRQALNRGQKLGVDLPDADGMVEQGIEALGRAREGGFTWDPRTGRFDWTEGMAVGVSPLHTMRIPEDEMTLQHLFSWLTSKGRHSSLTPLDVLKLDDQAMVGGWLDKGTYYLDVSRIFVDEDVALRIGGRYGEKALYSLTRGENVPVPDEYRVGLVESAIFADGVKVNAPDQPLYSGGFVGPSGETALLDPEGGRLRYSPLSQGQKQWILEMLTDTEPMFVVDQQAFLSNPEWMDWMRTLQGELLELTPKMQQTLLESADAVRGGLAEVPLFQFFDRLGMERLMLLWGKPNQTYRPLMAGILEGNFEAVAKDFAAMTNNFVRLLGPDAIRPGFYPLMSNDTIKAAQLSGVPAPGLAVALATGSRQAGPVKEAQTTAKAFRKLWARSRANSRRAKSGRPFKNWYIEDDGTVVWDGPKGLNSDPARTFIDFVNNPDWIMAPVSGASIKTYVYALLKLNPKIWRALVVDTVDTQIRIGTLGSQKFSSEKGALAAVEQALNQFVQRAVSSTIRVPVFGAQEAAWVMARGVRDIGKATPHTLRAGKSSGGKYLRQYYAETTIPPELEQIARRNYSALVDRVKAGDPSVAHWQLLEGYDDVIVPIDDLPIEMLLPPGLREGKWVKIFRDMVSTAERFGEYLNGRVKLPKLGRDMLAGATMLVVAGTAGISALWRPSAAMADEGGDFDAEDVTLAAGAAETLQASGLAQWAMAGGLLSVGGLRKLGPAAWGKVSNLRKLATNSGKYLTNITAARIKEIPLRDFGSVVTYKPPKLADLHMYNAGSVVEDILDVAAGMAPDFSRQSVELTATGFVRRFRELANDAENVRFFHPGMDEVIRLEEGSYTVPIFDSAEADFRIPAEGVFQIKGESFGGPLSNFGVDGVKASEDYRASYRKDWRVGSPYNAGAQSAINRLVGMNEQTFLDNPDAVISVRAEMVTDDMPLALEDEPPISLVFRFTVEKAFDNEADAMRFAAERGQAFVYRVGDGYTTGVAVPDSARRAVLGPLGQTLSSEARVSGSDIVRVEIVKDWTAPQFGDSLELERMLSQRFEIPFSADTMGRFPEFRNVVINYRNLEDYVKSSKGGYNIPVHAFGERYVFTPWKKSQWIMPNVPLPKEVADAQAMLVANGVSDSAAFLVAAARRQGFDGKPAIVTEEELIRLVTEEGWTPLFRGVKPFDGYTPQDRPTVVEIDQNGLPWTSQEGMFVHGVELAPKSAIEIAREFAHGEYLPGNGVWSHGFYMTPDLRYAATYAKWDILASQSERLVGVTPNRVIVAAAPPDFSFAPRAQVDYISYHGLYHRGSLSKRFFGDVDMSAEYVSRGYDGAIGERTSYLAEEVEFMGYNIWNRSKLVTLEYAYDPVYLSREHPLFRMEGSSAALKGMEELRFR